MTAVDSPVPLCSGFPPVFRFPDVRAASGGWKQFTAASSSRRSSGYPDRFNRVMRTAMSEPLADKTSDDGFDEVPDGAVSRCPAVIDGSRSHSSAAIPPPDLRARQ